jgi:hypothetical protein
LISPVIELARGKQRTAKGGTPMAKKPKRDEHKDKTKKDKKEKRDV